MVTTGTDGASRFASAETGRPAEHERGDEDS